MPAWQAIPGRCRGNGGGGPGHARMLTKHLRMQRRHAGACLSTEDLDPESLVEEGQGQGPAWWAVDFGQGGLLCKDPISGPAANRHKRGSGSRKANSTPRPVWAFKGAGHQNPRWWLLTAGVKFNILRRLDPSGLSTWWWFRPTTGAEEILCQLPEARWRIPQQRPR